MSEICWVEVTIRHETDDAMLVTQDPDNYDSPNIWVPKSQITDSTDNMDIGAEVEIEIPVWLAEEKELV